MYENLTYVPHAAHSYRIKLQHYSIKNIRTNDVCQLTIIYIHTYIYIYIQKIAIQLTNQRVGSRSPLVSDKNTWERISDESVQVSDRNTRERISDESVQVSDRTTRKGISDESMDESVTEIHVSDESVQVSVCYKENNNECQQGVCQFSDRSLDAVMMILSYVMVDRGADISPSLTTS